MIKRLAVYCGAGAGTDPAYMDLAQTVGKELATRQIELVYGGGRYGLMGAVATAVLDHGGTAHGVITRELANRGTVLKRLTTLAVVPTMDERKTQMMALADGLLALPGGLGTIEEISEAFSWTELGDNAKPVALYNFRDFYAPLKQQLALMERAGFVSAPYINAIQFADSLEAILDFMDGYQAPAIRTYPHQHQAGKG